MTDSTVLYNFSWKYHVQMDGRPEAAADAFKHYQVTETPISVSLDNCVLQNFQ